MSRARTDGKGAMPWSAICHTYSMISPMVSGTLLLIVLLQILSGVTPLPLVKPKRMKHLRSSLEQGSRDWFKVFAGNIENRKRKDTHHKARQTCADDAHTYLRKRHKPRQQQVVGEVDTMFEIESNQ